MTSELDEHFGPRKKKRPRKTQPEHGIIDGSPYGGRREPKKKRQPGKVTSKDLERIGEGLCKTVLKKFGYSLTKVKTIRNFYGGYSSSDVDYRCDAKSLKVEAKAWWIYQHNSFPLSRITPNEYKYLNWTLDNDWNAWITIALLRTDTPSKSACNELFVIHWEDWLVIEASLSARAHGNFQGKSLRERDLDLLDGRAIERRSGRWVIPDGHWLKGEVKR